MIKHVVSMSGGKDSLATALVCIETCNAEDILFAFADTGNEDQIVYDYLDYLEDALGIEIHRLKRDFSAEIARKRDYVLSVWPEEGVDPVVCERAANALVPSGNPFLDLCLWKGRFPSRKAQFCTQFLKTEPLMEFQIDLIDEGSAVWSWQGVRIDESEYRRRRLQGTGTCVKSFEVVGGGLFIHRPILRWSAEDCFDAAAAAGLDPNPLYRMGMKRVGCMPCVNCGKDEVLEIARRFPAAIDRIEEWEACVSEASKRGASTFFHRSPDAAVEDSRREVIFERARIRNVVEWAKTSRGGRQYDMFRSAISATESCSSAYGLCE